MYKIQSFQLNRGRLNVDIYLKRKSDLDSFAIANKSRKKSPEYQELSLFHFVHVARKHLNFTLRVVLLKGHDLVKNLSVIH